MVSLLLMMWRDVGQGQDSPAYLDRQLPTNIGDNAQGQIAAWHIRAEIPWSRDSIVLFVDSKAVYSKVTNSFLHDNRGGSRRAVRKTATRGLWDAKHVDNSDDGTSTSARLSVEHENLGR